VLPSYIKRVIFKPYSNILLYAIKHVGHFKKDLLENDFVHGICPITVSNYSVEFYKILEIGLA
jgi:hypothetical protein